MLEAVEKEWEGVKSRNFLATPREPPKDAILVSGVSVDLDVKLVGIRRASGCVELVASKISVDRRRVQTRGEELLGHRIDRQPSICKIVKRDKWAACGGRTFWPAWTLEVS